MADSLSECPFFSYGDCHCPEILYKRHMKHKKMNKKCIVKYIDDHHECKVFYEMNNIYVSILRKKFKNHLKLQQMFNQDEWNCVEKFIEKIAKDYYVLYYRDRYVKDFVRRFKTETGIALAAECVENESCPYIEIAKDVIKIN